MTGTVVKKQLIKKKRNIGLALKVTFGLVLLVLAIVLVAVLNADSPDLIRMAAYTYRTYNVKHTYTVIAAEKEREEEETDRLSDLLNKNVTLPAMTDIPANRMMVDSTTLYNGDYVAYSNALYQYLNVEDGFIRKTLKVGTADFEVDPVLYMAMCNTETGWQGDESKICSSAYPWKLAETTNINPDNCQEYFARLDTEEIYTKPANYSNSGRLYCLCRIWADHTNVYTIGPVSQIFGTGCVAEKDGKLPNESSQLSEIGKDKLVKMMTDAVGHSSHWGLSESELADRMINWTTGGDASFQSRAMYLSNGYWVSGGYKKHNATHSEYGDRNTVLQPAKEFMALCEEQAEKFGEGCPAFTKENSDAGIIVFLAMLRYSEWGPNACVLGNGWDDVANLWSDIAMGLQTEKAVAILNEYATELLDSPKIDFTWSGAKMMGYITRLEEAGVFNHITESKRPSKIYVTNPETGAVVKAVGNGTVDYRSYRAYTEPISFIVHYLALNQLFSGQAVN